MAWPGNAWHGIWYGLADMACYMVWYDLADMILYMVWPGEHVMVYDMA